MSDVCYLEDFGVALGVEVVVQAVGTVGFSDSYVHGLVGLIGGADHEAGCKRNVEEGLVAAAGGAGGAQMVELEVFWRGVLLRGFLF